MDISRFYFNNNYYKSLTQEVIDFLNKVKTQKNYPKGKDIFIEGTYPRGIFILEKGKIKIYQKTFEGAHQIMNIHVPGEIIGYRPLLCDERYPVTATSIEDCRVSFIPKKVFSSCAK